MALRLLVSALGDPERRVFRYDFDAQRTQILLGRRGGVDVLLPQAQVSPVHARIDRSRDGYQLSDEKSATGTTLNGAAVEPDRPQPLGPGDRIAIGEFLLEVAEVEGEDAFPAESSISIARRMVADVLGVLGPGDRHPALAVQGAPRLQLAIAEVGRRYVIGSAVHCDLVLDDPTVSPEHARLRRDFHGVIVADLGSSFGLHLNDRLVEGEATLRDGDAVTVGRVRLQFADPAEQYLRTLEPASAPSPARPPMETPAAVATAARGDRWVVAVAALIATACVGGLLWLWSS